MTFSDALGVEVENEELYRTKTQGHKEEKCFNLYEFSYGFVALCERNWCSYQQG
jgi:hypothetical protein